MNIHLRKFSIIILKLTVHTRCNKVNVWIIWILCQYCILNFYCFIRHTKFCIDKMTAYSFFNHTILKFNAFFK